MRHSPNLLLEREAHADGKGPIRVEGEEAPFQEEEAKPPVRAEYQGVEGEVCQECSILRAEHFLLPESYVEGVGLFDDGHPIITLHKSIEELLQSPCPLCRLFGELAPDWSETERPELVRYEVQLWSSSWVFTGLGADVRDREGLFRPTKLLAVNPQRRRVVGSWEDLQATWENFHADDLHELFIQGYLAMEMPEGERGICEVRALDVEVFDIGLAARWLSYCEENHGPACSDAGLPAVANLKVLDCRNRRVIDAPSECRYASLSYVWAGDSKVSRSSPSTKMAKVIEDSILVAQSLGFDYLWVDKICIDQTDERQKSTQIRQMDLIYARAAVAIIAAAGSDPDHGLPGVNGTKRIPQQSLKIGDMTMRATLPPSLPSILGSTWYSRGWTFQEGMLSRRRLIFTDWQVFFECNSMHCSEVVRTPLDLMHDGFSKKFDTVAYGLSGLPNKSPGSDPSVFMDHVADYTARVLTYAGDRLNAFEGVLNAFKRAQRPVYSFWGVPIFLTDGDMPRRKQWEAWDEDEERRMGIKSRAARFIISLFWDKYDFSSTVTRVPGFPSWSWTAWKASIARDGLLSVRHELPADMTVSFRRKTAGDAYADHLVSIDDIYLSSRMESLEDTYSSTIWVEAWTMHVNVDYITPNHFTDDPKEEPLTGYYVSFPAQPYGTVYSRLESFDHDRAYSPVQQFLTLLPSPVIKDGSRIREMGMLLEPVGDHYERVGMFRVAKSFTMDGGSWNYVTDWNGLDRIRRGFWLG